MGKILRIVLTLLFVGAVVLLGVNLSKNDKQFNQTDLDNAYQLGFYTAMTTEKEYKEMIKDLRQQVIVLQEDLTLSEEEKATAIAELNAQIEALNASLREYENAWDLSGKLMVTFYSDNNIHKIILVESGDNILDVEEPTKEGYIFQGWLKNNQGELIEDISTVTITEDTSFYASFLSENAVPHISITSELTWDEINLGENPGRTITQVLNLSDLQKYADCNNVDFNDWGLYVDISKVDEDYANISYLLISNFLNTEENQLENGFFTIDYSTELEQNVTYKVRLRLKHSSQEVEYFSDDVMFTFAGYCPIISFTCNLYFE